MPRTQPRNAPASHMPHARVEGSRGLTCFEFFQLLLQPVLQRKHLVIQATGWRGGRPAPCDCSHPPPSSLRAQPPSLHTLSLRGSYQLAVLACDFPPQLSVMLSFLASCHLENSGISLHPCSTPPHLSPEPLSCQAHPGSSVPGPQP